MHMLGRRGSRNLHEWERHLVLISRLVQVPAMEIPIPYFRNQQQSRSGKCVQLRALAAVILERVPSLIRMG